jgi:hypothetical protein
MKNIRAHRVFVSSDKKTVRTEIYLQSATSCQVSFDIGDNGPENVTCEGECDGICQPKSSTSPSGDIEYWCECV